MTGKHVGWLMATALGMGLLAPATTLGGPFLGEWGWCWRPARDCPHGEYSPLHYWWTELYRARACVHPANLDQFPPGLAAPVPLTYEFRKHCCPSAPAAPASPYADPTSYYGRAIAPE